MGVYGNEQWLLEVSGSGQVYHSHHRHIQIRLRHRQDKPEVKRSLGPPVLALLGQVFRGSQGERTQMGRCPSVKGHGAKEKGRKKKECSRDRILRARSGTPWLCHLSYCHSWERNLRQLPGQIQFHPFQEQIPKFLNTFFSKFSVIFCLNMSMVECANKGCVEEGSFSCVCACLWECPGSAGPALPHSLEIPA